MAVVVAGCFMACWVNVVLPEPWLRSPLKSCAVLSFVAVAAWRLRRSRTLPGLRLLMVALRSGWLGTTLDLVWLRACVCVFVCVCVRLR